MNKLINQMNQINARTNEQQARSRRAFDDNQRTIKQQSQTRARQAEIDRRNRDANVKLKAKKETAGKVPHHRSGADILKALLKTVGK